MTDQPTAICTLVPEDLKDLAELRRHEAQIVKEILELTEKLNHTEEALALQTAIEKKRKVSEAVSLLESFIRKSALEDYTRAGVKPKVEGVVIKLFKTLKYERGAAEKWAREKLPELFKFDEKGFEKYAKAVAETMPVPCVTIEEEARVEISTNLKMYL
ncbi:MAG TPA: hypothetical protein PK883_00695 [Anaerolineaceae bacterium]|nr:hypothetical protein [Anaerolineaceae bacterium]